MNVLPRPLGTSVTITAGKRKPTDVAGLLLLSSLTVSSSCVAVGFVGGGELRRGTFVPVGVEEPWHLGDSKPLHTRPSSCPSTCSGVKGH